MKSTDLLPTCLNCLQVRQALINIEPHFITLFLHNLAGQDKKTMAKTNALRLLDQKKITYRIIEYTYDTANLDVAKIANDNQLELAQVFKTLVCKGDKTGAIVAIIPGDEQLDLKQLAKASRNKKIALLPLKELTKITGYIRGGCSPLGMKKNYPTFIDKSAENWDEILINAGARGILFGVNPVELVNAFTFEWAEIC